MSDKAKYDWEWFGSTDPQDHSGYAIFHSEHKQTEKLYLPNFETCIAINEILTHVRADRFDQAMQQVMHLTKEHVAVLKQAVRPNPKLTRQD